MVSDDHGREALGCYGNPVIDTSNMDALAADGVLFTNSFCTTASCAASRSVILTGLYNHMNGTYGHTHSYHHFSCFDDVITLPRYLNDAGYRTGCIGKKHYAPEPLFPFTTDLENPTNGRNDVAMSEACRRFIGESEDPFFLYWCSYNPHRDSRVLENHPCRPNRFGNPDGPFLGDEERTYGDDEIIVPPFLTDNPEARGELAQYYQSISRLDRGIGRLVEILKDAGKYDATLIIYISDNGAAFPASKTTLYEPGMNLPCIVKCPSQDARGTVCNGLITWADIAPTVLDFAGAYGAPELMHGGSFRRIIGQENPDDWTEEVFASHCFHEITNYYPMRVVRTQRYKFIWNVAHRLTYPFASDLWASATWQGVLRNGSEMLGKRTVDAYLHHAKFELYDLEHDPHELDNLALKDEYLDMVGLFCEEIKAFQHETQDPWIHKWEYE